MSGPVRYHSIEIKSPELVFEVAGCCFTEEGGEVKRVTKALYVQGEQIAENAEKGGRGAPKIPKVDFCACGTFSAFSFP